MTIKKIATAALMASVALSPISPLTVPARADGTFESLSIDGKPCAGKELFDGNGLSAGQGVLGRQGAKDIVNGMHQGPSDVAQMPGPPLGQTDEIINEHVHRPQARHVRYRRGGGSRG